MASNTPTIIGRETRVLGRVIGTHDVEIRGHVDGELSVQGDVRVDEHGTVAAHVRGRHVAVRGAVKGDISADESIALEEGARVVGDLRAPRVAIAQGGLVRGYVETGKMTAAPARPVASAAKHVAAPPKAAHVAKAPAPAPKATPHKGRMTLGGGKAPPPVVPVLKKGTKAALTKKR
jgi:cytoskeletal protein CcmA (bactofilin family)